MIRKLILPALAAALLAGCATGYQYRGGSGDYYYGSPSTEYRYYGSPYGGYYGGYGYGGYGYGGYGYPYGGGYGYYSTPYYGGHHWHDRNDQDDDRDDVDQDPAPQQQRPTPPWRDLGALRERGKLPDAQRREMPAPRAATRPVTRPVIRPQQGSAMPRARSGGDDDDSGSRISEMLRRSQR